MKQLTGDSESSDRIELVSSTRRRAIIEGLLNKLPYAATGVERLWATQEARKAVQGLGPEATELEILQAANEAALSVAGRCERRLRQERTLASLWVYLPSGITQEERAEAEEIVCDLLRHLALIPESQLEQEIRRALAPMIQDIEQRSRHEKLVAHALAQVETVLRDLYLSGDVTREERYDRELLKDLQSAVAEALEDELEENPDLDTNGAEDIVRSVVAYELDLA